MAIQALETEHVIRGYDCGYGGPLRPFALANFFQEAAGEHAAKLGIGMEALFALGRTWMLSRIDIEIERLPLTGDRVVVRTWPFGTERIFAMRCMELLDSQGRRMAGALYDYFIYDINIARPLRPERILDPGLRVDRPLPYADLSPGLNEPGLFPAELPGNPQDAGWAQTFGLDVAPRHIDNNGHVNNAYFVNWLCDAIPPEERGTGPARRIKVDFIAEAKRGEQLKACWRRCGQGEFHSVILRDSQVIARALTRWE
ncbi:MAG: thioesterase [Spirochaetia bacterium]|jgi:acyl-ACP thioesterase|nr:thioesterase [Spirochaetia bacterium]